VAMAGGTTDPRNCEIRGVAQQCFCFKSGLPGPSGAIRGLRGRPRAPGGEGLAQGLAREAARAISGPPGLGGRELTSIVQRSLARFARHIFWSEIVHVGFRMILEVSGIGSLEIGVVQVLTQRFQSVEGSM
jgi:hypothetical protein